MSKSCSTRNLTSGKSTPEYYYVKVWTVQKNTKWSIVRKYKQRN